MVLVSYALPRAIFLWLMRQVPSHRCDYMDRNRLLDEPYLSPFLQESGCSSARLCSVLRLYKRDTPASLPRTRRSSAVLLEVSSLD